jgi:hypothetical protein
MAEEVIINKKMAPHYIHTSAKITDPSDLLEFARPGYKRVVFLTPRLRAHTDMEEAVAFKSFYSGELAGEDPPNPESVYVLTGMDTLLDHDNGLRKRMNEVDK